MNSAKLTHMYKFGKKKTWDIQEGIYHLFSPIDSITSSPHSILGLFTIIRCFNFQNVAFFIGYGLILNGNGNTK